MKAKFWRNYKGTKKGTVLKVVGLQIYRDGIILDCKCPASESINRRYIFKSRKQFKNYIKLDNKYWKNYFRL